MSPSTPPASRNLQPDGSSNERSQPQTPQPREDASAKNREKKRVGFAHDQQPPEVQVRTPEPSQTAPVQSPSKSPLQPQAKRDGHDSVPAAAGNSSLAATPTGLDIPGNRESFNREELTAALTQILEPDLHESPTPSPRPVLRKPAALVLPSPGPAQRSEVEAKDRADRLASALEISVSSPDLMAEDKATTYVFNQDSAEGSGAGHAYFGARSQARDSPDTHRTAHNLVRSHTKRKAAGVAPMAPITTGFSTSGTATPVAYDFEYVPRPKTYQGGVLGSLLRLYGGEDKQSPLNYDSVPSTPGRTPGHSPPTSRPSSPRPERPRLGKRNGHQRAHSASTLAELIGSSTMLAAPGTGSKDIPSAVSEKIKHDREQERARKARNRKSNLFRQDEEYHITVHIAEILSRHKYLIKLCRALMQYGAPTHRLEAYMAMSARVLGIEGQFLYFPGIMIISFDDSNTHTTEVKLVRAVQGIDLGRLRDVHSIYKDVIHDSLGVDEATTRLDAIMTRKDKFPVWMRVLLYGIASALVAPFAFEGRYIDLPIAFALGCIVGILQLVVAPSNELYANVFEISAAVLTSFLSRMFGSLRGGTLFCFSSLAQSSIAMILPGYMVLCGSLELQNHQMVSGSVRMIYSLIYTLFLGYGLTIGSIIYGYIDRNAVSDVHCSTADEWYLHRPGSNYYVLFVFGFTLAMCAINQAKYKQLPVMLVIALAGYLVNNYSSSYFSGNSTLSSTLGALCIGVLANFYSRLGRYAENWWLDLWEFHLEPRFRRLTRPRSNRNPDGDIEYTEARSDPPGLTRASSDPEAPAKERLIRRARKIGYGLSAAAMIPAIFVQVPGGLAVSGSLLSGIDQADQLTRNQTTTANGTVIMTTYKSTTDLNTTAFNVLLSVIQIAISISVGLSLSALLVYPLGKRRGGLFSL